MKKGLWVVIAGVLIVVIISISSSGEDSAYFDEVSEVIENRQRYLEFNEQSPFNTHSIEYRDPTYYPIDQTYKVNGKMDRITERQSFPLGTSDGKTTNYIKYGWITFTLKDQPLRLLVLKQAGMGPMNSFFCGFADATSGDETYGGGRYLDLEIGKSDKVVIDFNLAYNPYCAYVEDYVCPLPPPENILPLAITAGELDFK